MNTRKLLPQMRKRNELRAEAEKCLQSTGYYARSDHDQEVKSLRAEAAAYFANIDVDFQEWVKGIEAEMVAYEKTVRSRRNPGAKGLGPVFRTATPNGMVTKMILPGGMI